MLKFGGTSLASPKDIQGVAKTVVSFSKDNEIVVVCSAVDGVTDDLILISRMVEQKKKNDVRPPAKISFRLVSTMPHFISPLVHAYFAHSRYRNF